MKDTMGYYYGSKKLYKNTYYYYCKNKNIAKVKCPGYAKVDADKWLDFITGHNSACQMRRIRSNREKANQKLGRTNPLKPSDFKDPYRGFKNEYYTEISSNTDKDSEIVNETISEENKDEENYEEPLSQSNFQRSNEIEKMKNNISRTLANIEAKKKKQLYKKVELNISNTTKHSK